MHLLNILVLFVIVVAVRYEPTKFLWINKMHAHKRNRDINIAEACFVKVNADKATMLETGDATS